MLIADTACYTPEDWVHAARQASVVDIGQLTPAIRAALDKAARHGDLIRYRGHWDTRSPDFGTGPLKTIWTAP